MQQTADSCFAAMPKILIDYLWEIAKKYGDEGCMLVLTKRKLNGRAVQDITVFRNDGRPGKTVTVFGLMPADIALEISKRGENHFMAPIVKPADGYSRKGKSECPA